MCSAQVFEGHPFIVEAGVSVGGKDVKQVSISSMVILGVKWMDGFIFYYSMNRKQHCNAQMQAVLV